MSEHEDEDEDVATRRVQLRKWIDEKYDGFQSSFVAATEINQGELSGLLREKSFGPKKARKIEALAGMPHKYLEQRKGGTHTSPLSMETLRKIASGELKLDDMTNLVESQIAEPAYAMIEKMDIHISGGDGYLSEYVEVDGKYPLRWSVIQKKRLNPANLRVATVTGNSMRYYLNDGDVAFIDIMDRKIVSHEVYVFNTEDGERVKRLYKQLDGKIRVVSDNENKLVYPDEFLTPDTPFRISGRVVHRDG